MLVLMILLPAIWTPNNAQSQTDADSSKQYLYLTQWTGSVFSWQREGSACWVTDLEGNLRFEIMSGGSSKYPNYLDQLINWTGHEGWTAISIEGGGGTFSRWQEQWQDLSPTLNTWLRVVAHVLANETTHGNVSLPSGVREITPGGRRLPSLKFASANLTTHSRRLQLPAFSFETSDGGDEAPDFRKRMANRGRGRGGKQTTLTLEGNVASAEGLKISSTHNPGTLVLSQYIAIDASYKSEEVFLPWWPLSGYVLLRN